jgi:hypothetical protein
VAANSLDIRPFFILLLVAVILVLAASAIPTVGAQWEVSSHALEHAEAMVVINYVKLFGWFHRFDCKDGRVRYIVPTPLHKWAFVVLDPTASRVITAFWADQDYVVGQIDFCGPGANPWRYAHP